MHFRRQDYKENVLKMANSAHISQACELNTFAVEKLAYSFVENSWLWNYCRSPKGWKFWLVSTLGPVSRSSKFGLHLLFSVGIIFLFAVFGINRGRLENILCLKDFDILSIQFQMCCQAPLAPLIFQLSQYFDFPFSVFRFFFSFACARQERVR